MRFVPQHFMARLGKWCLPTKKPAGEKPAGVVLCLESYCPVLVVPFVVPPVLFVVVSLFVLLAPLVAGSGPLEITRVIVAPLLALVADCEMTVPCATLELYW